MENKEETAVAVDRQDPGFWREVWQQIRLVLYLMRDPDVPIYLKFIPFLALIYLIVPVDFLPDMAPVLGQMDDLMLILAGSKVFIELAPPHIVAQHLETIRARDGYGTMVVGEGEWVDEKEPDALEDAIVVDSEHEVVFEEKGPESVDDGR